MSINPTTINPDEINKFADHATDWWDRSGPLKTLHDINPARLDYLKQTVELNDLTVLDVGCGGGILCEAMARCGAKVTGIDAGREAINVATKHAQDSHLTIQYSCTPIETFDTKAYDVITCMEMLEHVDNPELVIEHCYRLLKPGGFLFLSTINRSFKAYVTAIVGAEYILGLLPRQTHDYKKFITPSELAGICRHQGLHLVNLKGLNYNPITRTGSLVSDVSVNYLMAFSK